MTSPGVKECALRARSTHGVHHANIKVNIIISVMLGEVHVVVRVHVPLVVDAVIDLTLSLIALVVILVFVVAIFQKIFAVLEVYCLQVTESALSDDAFLISMLGRLCLLCCSCCKHGELSLPEKTDSTGHVVTS